EHVAVEDEELLVRDLLGLGEAGEGPVVRLVLHGGEDVDAVRVVDPALRVGEPGDRRAGLLEQLGEVAAHVAEALDDDLRALDVAALAPQRLTGAEPGAAAGRL